LAIRNDEELSRLTDFLDIDFVERGEVPEVRKELIKKKKKKYDGKMTGSMDELDEFDF